MYYNGTFGSLDTVTAPGLRTSMVVRDGYGRDTASQAGTLPWQRHRMDKVNRDTVMILESGPGAPSNDLTHLTYSDGLHRRAIIDPL